jgi:hypothetical protein
MLKRSASRRGAVRRVWAGIRFQKNNGSGRQSNDQAKIDKDGARTALFAFESASRIRSFDAAERQRRQQTKSKSLGMV